VNIFRRRYLISLFYMMVITVGLTSWLQIPMELAPNIQLPSISVTHNWGSTSPEVMEQEVTRKVEQVVARLRDVEKIRSNTREGISTVTVEFRKDAPVEFRAVELQEYLFGIRETLPQSLVQRPISRSVPRELANMQTFMVYSIHGTPPPRTLLEIAERSVRLPLLGLEGISDIELQGVREPALSIVFNTDALEQLNLSSTEIMASIRRNLNWHSAGFADQPGGRYTIMVPPQFENVEDIERMAIRLTGSERQILLSDVASVELRDYPANNLKRINGSTALTIQFDKEGGADALSLSEEIIARMDVISSELPAGVTIRLELDNTEQLRKQLSELQTQSMFSVLSVFLVLLFFIRRFRAPFIILGSIIFSILISISILFFMGYTINVLTLAGLTVALGMIIDNAVVVFEYVNPKMPAGRDERIAHLRKYLPSAVVPVLGSTLTTIGIFVPLIFAMEELRVFLVPLSLSLSFTLLASVLVSLTWIPYSIIWLVPQRVSEKNGEKKRTTFIDRISSKTKQFVSRNFSLLRIFVWRKRLRWVLLVALIFAIGIPTFVIKEPVWEGDSWVRTIAKSYFDNKRVIDKWVGGVTNQFFSRTFFGEPWGRPDGEKIFVRIDTPQGTPLEEIDKIAKNFELVAEPYAEGFDYYETNVSEQFGARLTFHVKNEYLVRPEPYMLYAEVAYLAARTGNSRISVSGLGDSFFSGGGGFSTGNIQLSGFSYQELEETARNLQRRLEQNRRVQNVDINQTGFFSRGDLEQYLLTIDEDQIINKGMNRRQVLEALQVDINPERIDGRIEFQNQQMYLMGVSERRNQYWMDFRDRSRNFENTFFTMGEISELEKRKIMSEIRRENQSYTRAISYDFVGPNQMAQNFRKNTLEQFPLPIGTSVVDRQFWGFGQSEQRQNMLFVLLMALLSVWMIVSALLEKWRDPLVVILAVPLALLGVMCGILYHGLNFGEGAIAGTLLSIGVVVNNAILLMHDKERTRQVGIFGIRSWVSVYKNRIRAILITSTTTIAGLIPLILIGSDAFWNNLAVVVCWGLGFSTILLLIFTGIWEKKLIRRL